MLHCCQTKRHNSVSFHTTCPPSRLPIEMCGNVVSLMANRLFSALSSTTCWEFSIFTEIAATVHGWRSCHWHRYGTADEGGNVSEWATSISTEGGTVINTLFPPWSQWQSWSVGDNNKRTIFVHAVYPGPFDYTIYKGYGRPSFRLSSAGMGR